MNGKVASKQMMYAAALLIISTSLLTKPLYTFTKNDSWISVIAGFFAAALIYIIYALLAHRFPDKTIIEINDEVYGRILGKFVSVLNIYFFLTIASLDTNIITYFSKGFILQNTPTEMIIFVFLFVCAWAVRKGPVNMMKYSAFIMYMSIALVALNSMLLYKNTNFQNLLPSFQLKMSDYITGTHSVTMIPFSDAYILIMFLPDMQKPKDFGKAIVKGLTIGAVFLLFIVIRDISVLGNYTPVEAFPTYSAIRLIDVGDIITRMDIIYMSLLIGLMFYKVSLLFYAGVTGVQRLLKFSSYKTLITVFGAVLLVYSSLVVRSASEHTGWLLDGSGIFHHTFFVVALPLLTLIVAVFRGFYKYGEQDGAGQAAEGGRQT